VLFIDRSAALNGDLHGPAPGWAVGPI